MNEWVSLAGLWDAARVIADRRHGPKAHYASTRLFHKDSHFIGALGELTFGKVAGLPVDLRALKAGDDGVDFPGGIQVKASTHLEDPLLKIGPKEDLVAERYYLVVVDVKRKRARIAGYATRADILGAPRRDFGHGERLVPQLRAVSDEEIRRGVAA